MECQAASGGFSGMTEDNSNNLTWTTNTNKEVKSYIIPNRTENFYMTRVKRSVYINYFAKYIKAKYKEVFAQKEVDTYVENAAGSVEDNHPYSLWAADVTGGGTGKEDFTKTVLNASWRDAVSFAVIDNDIENGGIPYVYMKNAVEVSYDQKLGDLYETDAKGNLISIYFDYPCEMRGEQKIYKRRYWGIDEFYELESDNENAELSGWRIIEDTRVVNALTYKGRPFLPVKAIISQERANNHDYLPKPESYSIAEIVLAIYDRGSVLDYLIDKQGHSILVINGRTNGVGNGRDNAIVVSEAENKLFQPFFMSPDARLPEVHAGRIEKLTEEMLDMMDDGGVTASAKSVSQESGVSKSFSFSAKATTSKESLRLAMEVCEFLETGWKVYNNQGDASWKSVTTYPTEFIPQTEISFVDIDDAAEYFRSRGLRENEIEVTKLYIRKLFPNAKKELIESLVAEADGLNPTE
jgi:hypothetical protein